MTAAARLDLRLNPTGKELINRAADLRGVPVSAFVRDAVLREAENVMTAELTPCLLRSRAGSSKRWMSHSSPMPG